LSNSELQDVGDAQMTTRNVHRDLKNLAAIPTAIAIRTTQVDVREELHLDVLEAVASAGGAAAIARVEAERAHRVAALLGKRCCREQLANGIECTDVARWVRTRRATDRRLIHEHHARKPLGAFDAIVCSWCFRWLAE